MMNKNNKKSLDSALAVRLRGLWSDDSPSMAARAALAARVLFELPKAEHVHWASLIAFCFVELSGSRDPLCQDAESKIADSAAGSNLSGSIAWSLFAAVSNHASLDCVMEILRAIRPSVEGASWTADKRLGEALSRSALGSLAQARRYDDIVEIFKSALTPVLTDFESLLAHGGSFMDHPALEALTRGLFLSPGLLKASWSVQENRLVGSLYPVSFYFCVHPKWRDALLAKFEQGEPSLEDMANFQSAISALGTVVQRSPEFVDQLKAKYKDSGLRGGRSWQVFNDEQRSAALGFKEQALRRYGARMACLAKSKPAQAARIVLEAPDAPEDTGLFWDEIGLARVPASNFLFDPFHMPRTGTGPRASKERAWPEPCQAGADREQAKSIELNYMDCLALSGASRARLEKEAQRGARPSEGLKAAMALRAVSGHLKEEDQLWLASFDGNPAPRQSRRVLKA